jgi:hypothetical protein
MVLGFLAVVGEGHIAPLARQLHRHRRRERDALVRRPEQHVELDAAVDQSARIELGQPTQLRPVVEQACIEEVRAHAPGLRLELPEAQHAGVDGELDEGMGEGSTVE